MISRSTPRPAVLAYGVNVPIHQLLADIDTLRHAQSPHWLEVSATWIVLVALLVLAFVNARRLPPRRIDLDTRRGRFVSLMFSLGASVYVLTFALGNNWEYRLAFLILVLPQLFLWAESPGLRSESWLVLATIVASMWLAQVTAYPLFQLDQLVFYALFVYFVAVLVITTFEQADVRARLPQGIRRLFARAA